MAMKSNRRQPPADRDRRVVGYMGTPLWASSQFLNFLPYNSASGSPTGSVDAPSGAAFGEGASDGGSGV